jgi:hypothetical protein
MLPARKRPRRTCYTSSESNLSLIFSFGIFL